MTPLIRLCIDLGDPAPGLNKSERSAHSARRSIDIDILWNGDDGRPSAHEPTRGRRCFLDEAVFELSFPAIEFRPRAGLALLGQAPIQMILLVWIPTRAGKSAIGGGRHLVNGFTCVVFTELWSRRDFTGIVSCLLLWALHISVREACLRKQGRQRTLRNTAPFRLRDSPPQNEAHLLHRTVQKRSRRRPIFEPVLHSRCTPRGRSAPFHPNDILARRASNTRSLRAPIKRGQPKLSICSPQPT
jgi:hypothetical protein